jgi:hypothetical protein
LWLVPATVVGLAVARVSVWVQPHFAPVVLFPLLIGAALGAILCGIMQLARLRDLRLAVLGTIFVAVLAAAAEHVFFYLDRHGAQLSQALEAGIAEDAVARASFTEYMRGAAHQDKRVVLLWLGNAIAIVVAATAVVLWYGKARHGESSMGARRPPDPNGTDPE